MCCQFVQVANLTCASCNPVWFWLTHLSLHTPFCIWLKHERRSTMLDEDDECLQGTHILKYTQKCFSFNLTLSSEPEVKVWHWSQLSQHAPECQTCPSPRARVDTPSIVRRQHIPWWSSRQRIHSHPFVSANCVDQAWTAACNTVGFMPHLCVC